MKFTKILALALAAITASGLVAKERVTAQELGAKASALEEVIFRSGKRKNNNKRHHESKDSCSRDKRHSSHDSCSRDKKHHSKSKDSCSRDHKRSHDCFSRDHRHSKDRHNGNNSNSRVSAIKTQQNGNNQTNVHCPDRHDVLRIGLVPSNPYTTITENTATGFDVSIWCQLCQCLSRECSFLSYRTFDLAQTALDKGDIDVVGTSQGIPVPLKDAFANYNWIISRLCDGAPFTDRAYQFRKDCCQLVRDVQECFNALICDATYLQICGRIKQVNTTFNCTDCVPHLYESFCQQVVDEICICCTFPHKPCERRRTCDISCINVPVRPGPTDALAPVAKA